MLRSESNERGILLVLLSLCMAGCVLNVPKEHVVMFNGAGHAVDSNGNLGKIHMPFLPYAEYSDSSNHLNALFKAMKNYVSPNGKRRKLLIFVHGGLNSHNQGLKSAEERYQMILDQSDYYPVFITWQASLTINYLEHLFFIRQGKRSPLLGWLTAPIVLASDIARSVVRAPLVWGTEFLSSTRTWVGPLSSPTYADEVGKRLVSKARYLGSTANASAQQPLSFPIELGQDERNCREVIVSIILQFLTIPSKMALAPLIDTFGTKAWDNMLRHVRLLFRTEEDPTTLATGDNKPSGGLSVFFEKLINEIKSDDWEIAFVGHSMGTIVLNEIIREFGAQLPITDIVYLAGAASIRDYEEKWSSICTTGRVPVAV